MSASDRIARASNAKTRLDCERSTGKGPSARRWTCTDRRKRVF